MREGREEEEAAERVGWIEDGRLAYKPGELAGMVGVSAKTIYRAIGRGELRAARISKGTRLLTPARDALAWLEENLVEAHVVEQPERLPMSLRSRRGELRPLATVFAELDLDRSSGYDRRAT